MNKKKKIFLVYMLVQAIFIGMLPISMVQAAEAASDINVVSISTLNKIEKINDEISELRMKKASLTKEDSVSRAEIEKQIMLKKQEMAALGAEKVEHELLEQLIGAAMESINTEEGTALAYIAEHPDEIARIADQFEGMYDITGVAVNYDGKEQYHLIFTCCENDSHLHQITTKNAYDSFKANSIDATNILNDTIVLYGQKLFGAILAEIEHPIAKIIQCLPWEWLGVKKPAANQISSNGDALVVTLNTVSTQKFVFVRSSSAQSWDCCLSTNKVSCAVSWTEAVNINGEAVNKSMDYDTVWTYGNWNNATVDANTAFESNEIYRTCISEIRVHSTSKDVDIITHEIHTPMYIIHMI